MSIDIALTPDGRWQIGTEELLVAAHDAGFSAVGVSANRVDSQTAATYDRVGVRCHELLALMLSKDEQATLGLAERLAEAAALARARWVLTVFRARLTSETAVVIARCAAMFAEAGAKMAVEFSPLGPVRTLRDGLDVVEAAGRDRAGLMIDSWHFSFSESTFEDLAQVPLEEIAYLQFTDALEPVSDDLMSETMERRMLPGDGVLELDRFASTFLERGWQGLVSVEVLNRDLVALPVPEFARRAHAATARYWS